MFSSLNLSGQWLSRNGQQIVDDNGEEMILRGMGLGGWMLMEGYMMQTAEFANAQHKLKSKIGQIIGTEATEEFFDTWLANHVTKSDIDSLKSWGFNSVRLPMHYNLYTLPIEQEPIEGENTWLTKGFELTDQLLEWCKSNDMYVILDLHAAPGGQGRDEGISDYDPGKPSLWESQANQAKTVALWQRIAERYKDEPYIAGYDLINEPNWDIPGNILLRELYGSITEAIRTVDQRHIIFIEGNWFANDFTNLTPPWDDNMVYSPHKYWSVNDQASIQWVLDLREEHNVPLYLGESGENSNVWFRDAIRLLEDHNIGWAWWPMKKIESISGPLSITKSPGYQDLLDFWKGDGINPGSVVAKNTLMDLAKKSNIEECRYQKDVIDAMFRQIYSDETLPYQIQDIPGIVYATDYDMGILGKAYNDTESANYQVTTGNFTSWNNGWNYRNDGVDIEITQDNIHSNGYNIGWIASGEWLQYSVNVAKTAVYDVQLRVASNEDNGSCSISIGEASASEVVTIPNSNGWQNWQTVTIPNVVLSSEDKSFRFNVIREGFNLNSFRFIEKKATETLSTNALSAITETISQVRLDINKPLQTILSSAANLFTIKVDGMVIDINKLELINGNRSILFTVDHSFNSGEEITIDYDGAEVLAEDGTELTVFANQEVQNTAVRIHQIPGILQAEDYFFQSGIVLETTTDQGGGQNIGFLDVGDYLDYYIEVPSTGTYNIDYRTAAESESGAIELLTIEEDGAETVLQNVSFPPTGGWQDWATTSKSIQLEEGVHQLRIEITAPLFNINWLKFDLSSNTIEIPKGSITLSPNPSNGQGLLNFNDIPSGLHELTIFNAQGQIINKRKIDVATNTTFELNIEEQGTGLFILMIQDSKGAQWVERWIKL